MTHPHRIRHLVEQGFKEPLQVLALEDRENALLNRVRPDDDDRAELADLQDRLGRLYASTRRPA